VLAARAGRTHVRLLLLASFGRSLWLCCALD
jgi:hypothetical protein